MISALSWVPKGAARKVPFKNEPTEALPDMPDVSAEELQQGAAGAGAEGDFIDKLLEHYDSDSEEEDVPKSLANLGKDLMFYDDPADDPYMQGQKADGDDSEDSDQEEMVILPNDGVLVRARPYMPTHADRHQSAHELTPNQRCQLHRNPQLLSCFLCRSLCPIFRMSH